MAASPLLTCNDVRNMSAAIKEILTNEEVLAVHKDPLAKMAVRIDVGGGLEETHSTAPCSSDYSVYSKELYDGSSAVMVLNRGEANMTVNILAEDVGDSMHTYYNVRDLWQHTNLTMTMATNAAAANPEGGRWKQQRRRYTSVGMDAHTSAAISAGGSSSHARLQLEVPSHGVRMLRMWPIANPPPPPPPPPPQPRPACPGGFVANNQSGYWKNLQFQPQLVTVDECGTKCKATASCVAFELYLALLPAANNCYIFVGMKEQPFTQNAQSVTCLVV